MQIVRGKNLEWNESSKISSTLDIDSEEFDWVTLEADLNYWTKALRPVQVGIRCGLHYLYFPMVNWLQLSSGDSDFRLCTLNMVQFNSGILVTLQKLKRSSRSS